MELSTPKVLLISIVTGVVLLAGIVLLADNTGGNSDEQVPYPIKFEEFADYECPACAAYHPLINQLREEYAGDINYSYRHFPLTSIHEFARPAAIASEAAREQGKFDEYSDLLFANQNALKPDDLLGYAQQLELDLEKFQSDLENQDVIARVEADEAEAAARALDSTPSFFINGERFNPGTDPETRFRATFDELITKAKSQQTQAAEEAEPQLPQ